MCQVVKATLAKKELQETFLEFDLLGVVKRWLQVGALIKLITLRQCHGLRGSKSVVFGMSLLSNGWSFPTGYLRSVCLCHGRSFMARAREANGSAPPRAYTGFYRARLSVWQRREGR